MSTSVTGKVLLDSGGGIPGLRVVVRSEGELITSELGRGTTDSNGTYTISIKEDPFAGDPNLAGRKLGVYIFPANGSYTTSDGKIWLSPRQLSYASYEDTTGASLTANDVTLKQADLSGWTVSLPGTTNALPVRSGNAVRLLVDDKVAWERVDTAIGGAQKSISVMQLEIDVPRKQTDNLADEVPEIILAFPATFDPENPTPLDGTVGGRPERLFLDAADAGKEVRVMIPHPDVDVLVAVVDAVVLLIPMLVGLIGLAPVWTMWTGIWEHIFGPKGDADALSAYFTGAGSAHVEVTEFKCRMFSYVHSKAVLIDAVTDAVDNAEAIVLGSPFQPSYWDTVNHSVYEPRRGDCAGEPIPVHDVSLGIRGPAVADLQQQFGLLWNRENAADDQVAPLDPPPGSVSPAADELPATVQLVRTVDSSTLPGLDAGEQGVLEAYLRAIENATEYIYIENQYFTNDTIAKALVTALKDPSRPNLQVILMVCVVPDMPFYPTWQTNLIERIRRDAGTDGASRFGVFTAWSHNEAEPDHKHDNPIIMPNYLHTKTAVVDGKWATIGSANLDGASLDRFQILTHLQFGSFRNHELNYLMFNGADGLDPSGTVVDQLRLQLWSEHLGIGVDDPRLSKETLSASHGWLKLWTDTATAKLQGLIDDPSVIDPGKGRVLAYPPGARSGYGLLWQWSDPFKNFLEASQIDDESINLAELDIVRHTTAFWYDVAIWADE